MGLMSLIWHPAVLVAAAGVFTYFIGSWIYATRRPKDFPPGPPPVLVFGNVLQFPPNLAFLKFHEWKDTYGDIMGLKMGTQNMVVLSSAEHVRELFEKRGAIYSDRPQPYINSKLINPANVLFINNGPRIKKYRLALRHLLAPAELRRVMTLQAAQSALLMRKVLESPQQFHWHMKHWALATPLSILSGQAVTESGIASASNYFATQDAWLKFLTPAQAPPVDLFPILKYFPRFLASWKREAAALSLAMRKTMYHMLDGAKLQHARIRDNVRNTETESIMTRLITEGKNSEELRYGDHELAAFGSSTLDAAVDTIIATTSSMVLFLAAFPEVQKRVQAEVDSIWHDKVPEPEGLANAKYLKACMMEAMRWRPATPSAVPRVLSRDDTYSGFKFSKGTTFLINTWSIHRDTKWYDFPEEFRPERYLDNRWGVKPSMKEAAEKQNRRPTYNFGAGRRMCPGLEYAENQIMVTIAKFAWDFDIVPKGQLDTRVETGYHSGLVMGPEHFDVDFVPRSDERKQKILEDSAKAEKIVAAWVA